MTAEIEFKEKVAAIEAAPTFEKAYESFYNLRNELLEAEAAFREENQTFLTPFEEELNAIGKDFQDRLDALEIMLRVVSRVAPTTFGCMPAGVVYSEDASCLFYPENGLQVLAAFQNLTERIRCEQGLSEDPQGIASAAKIAEGEVLDNPLLIGSVQEEVRGELGTEWYKHLGRLTQSFRAYCIAEAYALHGGLDQAVIPEVASWMACRAKGEEEGFGGAYDPGDGRYNEGLKMGSYEGHKIALLTSILHDIDGSESKCETVADFITQVRCSLVTSAPKYYATPEGTKEIEEALEPLRKIAAGLHPADPELEYQGEAFRLLLFYKRCRVHVECCKAIENLKEKYYPDKQAYDHAFRRYVEDILQPNHDRAVIALLNTPFPWNESSDLNQSTREAQKLYWQKRVAKEMNYLRLVADQSGNLSWAGDVEAGRKHFPVPKNRTPRKSAQNPR